MESSLFFSSLKEDSAKDPTNDREECYVSPVVTIFHISWKLVTTEIAFITLIKESGLNIRPDQELTLVASFWKKKSAPCSRFKKKKFFLWSTSCWISDWMSEQILNQPVLLVCLMWTTNTARWVKIISAPVWSLFSTCPHFVTHSRGARFCTQLGASFTSTASTWRKKGKKNSLLL